MHTIAAHRNDKPFAPKVVLAVFLLAIFGWGVGFYGPPIFLNAVIHRTGWSIHLVSAAVTLHFLFGAFVVANFPRIHRIFGVASSTGVGATVTALGVLGWALASSPWQLFLASMFTGAGWASMGAVAVNAIISAWFSETRPIALARAYNGASIGGVIFSPLWVLAIEGLGFPMAAVVLGAVMIFTVGGLAIFVFSRKPDQFAETAGAGPLKNSPQSFIGASLHGRQLWTERKFLTLAGGMAAGLFAQIGLTAYMFLLLVPAVGAQYAGLTMGFATACAVAGRMSVARAMPSGADRRILACAGYVVQLMGSLMFLGATESNLWMIFAGITLFGLGIGNSTSIPPAITQVEFSKEDVPRVIALIVALSQATYAFAPMLFGAFLAMSSDSSFHIGPGTTWFFLAAALIQLLAISLFLIGRERKIPV